MADSKQKRIDELLEQIRSVPTYASNNDAVHQAIDELRSEGWLQDESLQETDLEEANLREANLREADLRGAKLGQANLREAKLGQANLRGADLGYANLREANLGEANLGEANLRGANLRRANLWRVNLQEANLQGATLTKARMSKTVLADVDLSFVEGLETIRHRGASTLSHETLFNYARLPDVFLKGCGLPEIFITYYDALREEAIMFYDVFISYSHADKTFTQRLHNELQSRGVRCWLDEHDLPVGHPIDAGIRQGIKLSGMTILCCSENSLNSDWVNDELTTTFNEERKLRKDDPAAYRLLPIDLDGAIFEDSDELRVTDGKLDKLLNRKMLNMQAWDDLSTDAFNAQVEKLVNALRRDPAADD